MNTGPRFFGRDPLADWPEGTLLVAAGLVLLAALVFADQAMPGPVTLGSLAVIAALGAGVFLSGRLLAVLLIAGVLSRAAAVLFGGVSPLTAAGQSLALVSGGALVYLAMEALRTARRRAEETDRLNTVVAAATELAAASLSPADLVAQLLLYSVLTTGADWGSVFRIEGEELIVEAAYDAGDSPLPISSRWKLTGQPMLMEVVRTQQPVRGAPIVRADLSHQHAERIRAMRDTIVFPLVAEGGVQGVLALMSSRERAFTDAHIAAVEQVTTIASLALNASRLFADAKVAREEAEAAAARLRESQRGLSEAQQLVHLGSWRWNLTTDRIAWSDEMYRIFGLQPAERAPTYDEYLEHVHPDDRDIAARTIREAIQTGKPFDFEHRIVRADGSERTVHALGRFDIADGRPVLMSGTVQDITERKQAELLVQRMRSEREKELGEHAHRMEALERLKSEFLMLASHELRGPLSVLTGYISLMAEGALGELPEAARTAVATMAERSAAMTRLIEELLQTARLEHGFELDLKPLDLRDIAREAIRSVTSGTSQKIASRMTREPVPILGDRDRLTIIVSALLDNALKYGGPDPAVACAVNLEAGWGVVSVSDTGPGITEEDLPKLFTRFGRIVNAENAHIQGTGLGLYLAQNLARMHRGRISVVSEAGKGSTFALRLPIASESLKAETERNVSSVKKAS